LQGAGYRVVTAMDGSEAVAAARKENPDLILLDISFPPNVGGVEWDGFRTGWKQSKRFRSSSSPAARTPNPKNARPNPGRWRIFRSPWSMITC
jgi:CheY-like chemotaxis protein